MTLGSLPLCEAGGGGGEGALLSAAGEAQDPGGHILAHGTCGMTPNEAEC